MVSLMNFGLKKRGNGLSIDYTRGLGRGGDISGITPSIYMHPNQHPDWCGGHI